MGLHTQSRESESRVETKLRVPKGQRQHSLISISPSEAPLTSPRMARNPPSAFDPPWHELSPLFRAFLNITSLSRSVADTYLLTTC